MPLVEIAQLLVVDLSVDFYTLHAIFLHQAFYHRRHDFFVDLMYAERHGRMAVVFGCPFVGEQVVANARTFAKAERLVALYRVFVVESFVADSAYFVCLKQRRIVIVRRFEYLVEHLVRAAYYLIGRRQFHCRDGLYAHRHRVHQVLEHVFKLLGVARQRIFQLVDLAEVVDGAVVAMSVEHVYDGMTAGIRGRKFFQEAQIVGAVGNERQVDRLHLGVVHTVRDGADGTVELPDVVALRDFLY